MPDSIRIFILDRGFVVVGRGSLSSEIVYAWQVYGRTIRRWGTSNGLAELCNGPLANTVLDPACHRLIPFRSIIEILEVEQEKWETSLPSNKPSSVQQQTRKVTL